MFKRIKRLFQAWFGAWLSTIEEPELILQQNIRDINEHAPRMNESIAMVRANVAMFENEKHRLETKKTLIEDQIQLSLRSGKRDLARQYAFALSEINQQLEANLDHLSQSRDAFLKALEIKKIFMKEKERKTREAVIAIREAERAKWQRQIAHVLQTFDYGDINQTHEEMIERLDERSAHDRAYLDMALRTPSQVPEENGRILLESDAEDILARFEEKLDKTPIDRPENECPPESHSEDRRALQ